MLKLTDYKKFWQKIKKSNNFFLVTHNNPDGDGLCSMLIFAIILKSLKKKYLILAEDSFPEKFKFLIKKYANYIIPEYKNIPKDVDFFSSLPAKFNAESIIIIDSCGNDRLGRFGNIIPKLNLKNIFNIDHHNGKRKFPGPADLINKQASATAEIIFELLKINNYKLTEEIAELIYIAMTTDTRNFTQSNTNERCHEITAELIKTGVSIEEINFALQEIPAQTLKIFGRVINRLKLDFNNKLVWSYITRKELKQCLNRDTEGLIEILRNIKDTKVTILIKEISPRKVKVSLRGKNGFNVFAIAKKFDGGGHLQAAGFNINNNLKNSIKILFKNLKKYIK